MTLFLKQWWIETDFKTPNLPLLLRLKGSDKQATGPGLLKDSPYSIS
jgi:hypothetical protein